MNVLCIAAAHRIPEPSLGRLLGKNHIHTIICQALGDEPGYRALSAAVYAFKGDESADHRHGDVESPNNILY